MGILQMMKKNEDFEDIYLKYRKFSVNVALQIVKNRTVAEDISQDVFYKLFRRGKKLDTENEAKLRSLIFTATVNCAKDYYKKAYVKREQLMDDEGGEEKAGDDRYNPEARLLRMEENEYQNLVLQKLDDKNPVNYDILIKTKFMGISPDSVAEEYGFTRNNVNNRILRTKVWIRDELSKLYHKDV